MGTRLEEHYRNANIRLAVSQSFLNRFLPQPGATVAPVRDTIAGAEVEGQSTTYTRLALLLIPDRNRLRMGIEAHGTVQSNTAATSGPATFHSTGESQFVARKLLLLGPQGMTVFPAMSEAESKRQQLVSVETNFDRVPLLNSVVRNIARSEHDASQGAAVSEVEQKIAARARVQFDSEFDPKLHKSLERFNERVRAPLDRLGLEPQTLAASSSDDRAVLRLRLAGQDQLAAYTPRPAPLRTAWSACRFTSRRSTTRWRNWISTAELSRSTNCSRTWARSWARPRRTCPTTCPRTSA